MKCDNHDQDQPHDPASSFTLTIARAGLVSSGMLLISYNRLRARLSSGWGHASRDFLPILTPRSLYHTNRNSPSSPFPPATSTILSVALSHVPSFGFTTTSLSNGARDAGYLDSSINLFPRGVFDLVNYHLVMQRLALKRYSQSLHGTAGIGAKLKMLMLQRLYGNRKIIHHWQEVWQFSFI